MPKITTIDKLAAKKLHELFNRAIKDSPELCAMAEDFGLKVTPMSASYDATHITIKVELRIPGATDPMTAQLAAMEGLDISKVGKDGCKIVGYNGRAPRMPWKLEMPNGRTMKAATRWCLMNGFAADKKAMAEAED